jgi:CheY-like chemotaxis protein
VTFATTDEALDQIEAAPESISLAMLDLTMPGLDSRELARRLLVANPLARVIICSGYPAELSELEAAGPGRVSFLHKPFSPDMLEELVRHMLPPADATTL